MLNQPVSSREEEMERLAGGGVKIKTKSLKDEETFKCSVADLYRVLTDRDVSLTQNSGLKKSLSESLKMFKSS